MLSIKSVAPLDAINTAYDLNLKTVRYAFYNTRLHLQGKVARRAIVFNNIAQIMQSCTNPAISQIRIRHMRHALNTHETSLIKPRLTELDEIYRNKPKSNYNLAKNLQSWSVTSDGHTHRRTEIHTFFIWYPRVGREHNSPSGNKDPPLNKVPPPISEEFEDVNKVPPGISDFSKF